jgi:hypothetical protein
VVSEAGMVTLGLRRRQQKDMSSKRTEKKKE